MKRGVLNLDTGFIDKHSGDNEEDQQNEHDVDQRGDVDFGLDGFRKEQLTIFHGL